MDERRLAVVRQELGVVGAQELPDLGRERRRRRVRADQRVTPPLASALRAAASSVSSAAIWMKPSAASCGNVSPAPYDASVSA